MKYLNIKKALAHGKSGNHFQKRIGIDLAIASPWTSTTIATT